MISNFRFDRSEFVFVSLFETCEVQSCFYTKTKQVESKDREEVLKLYLSSFFLSPYVLLLVVLWSSITML
jgi:hypothetical protein